MAKNGKPRQTLTKITEVMAMPGSPSHSGPRKNPQFSFRTSPKILISTCHSQRRVQLNTLNVASNIHSQASVLRTVGTIKGSNTVARVIFARRNLRFSNTASHMPRTALKTVATVVKNTVFQAAVRKISLANSLS